MSSDMSNLDINEIIASLIERVASKFWKKTNNFFINHESKIQIDLRTAFSEYLKLIYYKHSRIKTLIYKNEPRYLYDFYQHNSLSKHYYEEGDNTTNRHLIDTAYFSTIMKISHYVIIEGSAGMGKTTMMKHFLINTISTLNHIPVFIELRNIQDQSDSLFDHINNALSLYDCNLTEDALIYALHSGCFVVFLDGLDEIAKDNFNFTAREINRISGKYRKNYFILSSRPIDYSNYFNSFTTLKMIPFSKNQALSYVKSINYDRAISDKFYNELDHYLYDKHKSFASNPLLLTILLLTFDQFASIPDKIHLFYADAFETLYRKHDATKDGFVRIMSSHLAINLFKKIFAAFCFMSYVKNEYYFPLERLRQLICLALDDTTINEDAYIDDLLHSVCMLQKDGLGYTFIHRSFQEYFCAVHIASLTDEYLSKALLYLFGDFYRHENICNFIYDMEQNRVEKTFIIPLLRQVLKEAESYSCAILALLLSGEISHSQFSEYHTKNTKSSKRIHSEFEGILKHSGFVYYLFNIYKYYLKEEGDGREREKGKTSISLTKAQMRRSPLIRLVISDKNLKWKAVDQFIKRPHVMEFANYLPLLLDDLNHKYDEEKEDFYKLFNL